MVIMIKRIAGYYRLSMEDDVKLESNSITNQRLLVKKYVSQDRELCRYEFCEFYDDGYSGTTMNRPGLQEMLERIKRNEIQVVIVKDISRFSRDYIELGTFMEQIFPFMGVRFIAITDRYDSKDYIDRTTDMDIAFKSLLADFYCKDVSAKVKSSLEAKRKQGKYSTGLAPFGYGKDEKDPYKLVVVPEEAEIVRYIFQLSVLGYNLTQICKKLNDDGVMTPLEYKNLRKKQNRKELRKQHKFWQAGTVRAILTNESYIGSMVYDKTEQAVVGSGKRKVKPKEEWKVFEKHHEPIVDKEIFDAVQTKYYQKKSGTRKSIEYPLKGKLLCGYCMRTLKVMKPAGKKIFFYCPSKKLSSSVGCMTGTLSNEKLEGIILSEIKRQLALLADMSTILQASRLLREERIKEQERDLTCLEKKVQEFTEQKAAFLENYHAGILDKEQYKENRNKIAQKLTDMKSEYERKKKDVEQQIKTMNNYPKACEDILCYSGRESLTREMVEAFVDRIEIDGSLNIDIYWTFNNQFDWNADSATTV